MRDFSKRKTGKNRVKRPPKPLDAARLEELAVSYVARFATSAAKLEKYLQRKLRERGFVEDAADSWLPDDGTGEGNDEIDPAFALEAGRAKIAEVVAKFVERNYVDDDEYAKNRAGSLLNRGFGGRRIEATLRHDGIAEDVREANAPDRNEAREAALALAKKRRFGPFARDAVGELDDDLLPEDRDFETNQAMRKLRDKQLAAMVRAGHEFSDANAILNARSVAQAEEWASGESDA